MDSFFLDKKGSPFFVLGLQSHNSSTGTDMIGKTIHAIKQYGGNTLEAPVYWNRLEPEKDKYDMSLVRGLIDEARKADLRLVILWFATSKNGHPNYAPDYIKTAPETYRIALGSNHAPVASLSPHCTETLQRDLKAYLQMMSFIADYDKDEKTVLAMQIENEFGYANTDRDYSKLACMDYEKPVPEVLWDVKLEDCGSHDGSKTWKGLFGRHAHEAFSAWYHAQYVEAISSEGKKVHNIPTYVNMMVGETYIQEPGINYNSGAAVARVLDIWKKGAPSVDLMCPDIYSPAKRDFTRIASGYDREDNALFIPESITMGEASAMNTLLAVADYGAIGICGFGAESTLANDGTLLPEAETVALSMKAIRNLEPLLIKYRKTGKVHAFVQDEFSNEQYLRLEKYHVVAHFMRDNPSYIGVGSKINMKNPENHGYLQERGRGLFIEAGEDEFYLAGAGIGLEIIRRPSPEDTNPHAHITSRQSGQLNFLSVEEGHFEDGVWVVDYIRNGDESNFYLYSHGGQAVRIRMNPNIGMDLE